MDEGVTHLMKNVLRKITSATVCIILAGTVLAGCSKEEKSQEPEIGVIVTDKGDETPAQEEPGAGEIGAFDMNAQMENGLPIGANISELPGGMPEGTPEELAADGIFVDEAAGAATGETYVDGDMTTGGEMMSQSVPSSNPDTIVWLGDSLTQGSLGHENDNLANAPYVELAKLTGRVIEGYGYYGYKTHDIFWVYVDENHENQKKDPAKTYVFWVGSNDWVVDGKTNDDAQTVIDEIDSFVSGGGITKYIVLGTTARYELRKDYKSNGGVDLYQSINDQLKEHYGDKYLDVNSVISIDDGYGPDNIHLTQESYNEVASLVDKKIKEMGW